MKRSELPESYEHNTPENMDVLFGDPEYLSDYCCQARIDWYGEVIEIFREETGFEFDGKDILDAGCGTGHALKYIHDHYEHGALVGVDFSSKAIEIMGEIVPAAIAMHLDLITPLRMKYDFIMSLEVFEHLLAPIIVLENLKKALKTGGFLFITVPDGELDDFVGHINRWTLDEFIDFTDADIFGRHEDAIFAIYQRRQDDKESEQTAQDNRRTR